VNRRYLVVANQTLNSSHLLQAVVTLVGDGPARVHLLVPATPARDQLTWTEGEARSIAQRRLQQALDLYRCIPGTVEGEVGDANPLQAVRDQLDAGKRFDLIVVSTLPPGLSRWLRQDLAKRIHRSCGLPVQHVEAPPPATVTRAGRSWRRDRDRAESIRRRSGWKAAG
jgi:hypothetical protein